MVLTCHTFNWYSCISTLSPTKCVGSNGSRKYYSSSTNTNRISRLDDTCCSTRYTVVPTIHACVHTTLHNSSTHDPNTQCTLITHNTGMVPAYPGAPAMMLASSGEQRVVTPSFQMLQPAPTAPTHIEREQRQRRRKRRHGKNKSRDDYTTSSSDSSSSSGTEHKKRSARKRLKKSKKEDRKKRISRSKSNSKGNKKKRRKEADKRRRDAKSSSSSDSDSRSSSSCYD